MMPLLFDLNDLGIRCYQDSELLFQSPGVAVVDKPLLLGTEAWQASRKNPLNTHSQFWSQLNTEPLHVTHPQVRHHGDLAYLHLLHIESSTQAFADQEVVFALPASTSKESLRLLLGIAQQCGLKTIGLVDNALASVINHAKDQKQWHLEIYLNQCVLTELTLADNRLQRTQIETFNDQGWLSLHNQLLRYFSEQFIQQTRFNPRHIAETEQKLFDAIPLWLQECMNAEKTSSSPFGAKTLQCDLESSSPGSGSVNRNNDSANGNSYSIQVDIKELQQFVHKLMQPLHEQLRHRPNLYLGDRIGQWAPLLMRTVAATALTQPQVAAGLATATDAVSNSTEGIRFISNLPCEGVPQVFVETRTEATHLLWRHAAYPLQGHFSLSLQGDMLAGEQAQALLTLQDGSIQTSTNNLSLNDNSYTPSADQTFLSGDTLKIGGLNEPLTFIRVER